MLGLRDAAERDFRQSRYTEAAAKATELLVLAERFPTDWFYGNAIHHGHLLLGRIALARERPLFGGWKPTYCRMSSCRARPWISMQLAAAFSTH